MNLKESQEIRQILDFLMLKGCFVWRNNSGVFKKETITKAGLTKSSFVRAGIKGSSDIIGITPSGKFLAIEIKTSDTSRRKGLTMEQELFKMEISSRGGVFILADKGFDDFAKQCETVL